jgi:hypothetical protein
LRPANGCEVPCIDIYGVGRVPLVEAIHQNLEGIYCPGNIFVPILVVKPTSWGCAIKLVELVIRAVAIPRIRIIAVCSRAHVYRE